MSKNYKFLGESKHEYHIGHPDGSFFSISKSHISQELHDKVKSFAKAPKLFGGGFNDEGTIVKADGSVNPDAEIPEGEEPSVDSPVDLPVAANSVPVPPNEPSPMASTSPSGIAPSTDQPPTPDMSVNPPAPSNGQAPGISDPNVPQGPGVGPGTPSDGSELDENFKQQKNANSRMATAVGNQGAAEAKATGEAKAQIDDENKRYDAYVNKAQDDSKRLEQEIHENKIKPMSLLDAAGSGIGNKILATLGVVLGNIGGGSNQALEILKGRVQQDIDSQMTSLSNKKTLYSANLEKTKDARLAHMTTLDQMLSGLKMTTAQIAGQSAKPIAQANAQKLNTLIDGEKAQLHHQIAMYQAQAQVAANGTVPGSNLDNMTLMDKEKAPLRVVVGNHAYQATSKEGATEIKKMQTEVEPVKRKIQELNALVGPNALIPGSTENQRAASLMAQLPADLNKLHGYSRLSDADIDLWKHAVANPAEMKSYLQGKGSKLKNSALLDDIDQQVDSTYKAHIANFKGLVSTSAKKGFK